MRSWTTLVSFLAGLSLALAPGANGEARLVDATGVEIPRGPAPSRVVTLAPSLGELAADLLDERMDRIVGVTDYTDYPPALAKVASVGPYSGFNVEKVAALRPDVVIATTDGNRKDQVKRLRELGLRVVVVRTSTFSQIEESIALVGEALGVGARGRHLARQLREGVERIRARAKASKDATKKVLLQVGGDPLVVAGAGSFLSESLEIIGARNAYADLRENYPRPALEDVIRRDPDLILVMALGKDAASFDRMAARWSELRSLRAVRNGRVGILQADPLLRPSMRLLEGLGILERTVYPERQ